MVKNELEFRDLVDSLLQQEGFDVESEFRAPEGFRVDLLAIKNDKKYGIEVKLNQRGISDDISKGSILHKLPEFDFFYIAAPSIFLHTELLNYAEQLRIGAIGVGEKSLKWLQQSEELTPPQLLGGYGLPTQERYPGSVFEVLSNVRLHGEKVVRNLETYFIPSGPFVTAPGYKSRYKKSKLSPKESWEVTFKIRIKRSSKLGTYPLYTACTADNVHPSQIVWNIEISE